MYPTYREEKTEKKNQSSYDGKEDWSNQSDPPFEGKTDPYNKEFKIFTKKLQGELEKPNHGRPLSQDICQKEEKLKHKTWFRI